MRTPEVKGGPLTQAASSLGTQAFSEGHILPQGKPTARLQSSELDRRTSLPPMLGHTLSPGSNTVSQKTLSSASDSCLSFWLPCARLPTQARTIPSWEVSMVCLPGHNTPALGWCGILGKSTGGSEL